MTKCVEVIRVDESCSNTHQYVSGLFACAVPGCYSLHRLEMTCEHLIVSYWTLTLTFVLYHVLILFGELNNALFRS